MAYESSSQKFKLLVDIQDATKINIFTVTIGAPAIVTMSAHGLNTGDSIVVTSSIALPTGLTIGATYYVIKIDINTFNLALTYANAIAATKITTTGTQSGVNAYYRAPAYTVLCPLNLDYDQGEVMDSWNDLCSNIMNNVKVALDPTWSTAFKFDKTDPVAQYIIAKEFATGIGATAPIRIVNLLKGLNGKQIDFIATLSGISYSGVTEEVLNIAFDIKVYKNTTFVENDYIAS